jgi:penicillin-binding protein 1A
MYRAPRIAPDQQRSYVAAPAPEYEMPRRPEAAPRRRRWRWALVKWLFLLGFWGGAALALALVYFAWDLPRPEAALDAVRRPSLTLTDTSGRLYASYGDVVGEPLRLADLPPMLPQAAVDVEDRRFWSHHGIDFIGIARAALVNLRAGRVVQGGSTITQQVAKNLFLTNARTAKRKVQEVLLTLWLERTFTKAEILEIWLNRVYLGSGAWGVDAAAQMYFGISARNLNLWQSAVIAGLPRAPSRFSPRVDPAAAAARGREVLAAMADVGTITAEQAREAGAQIVFPPRSSIGAGWFADWAAERAQSLLPAGADATLRTTLDSRMQGIVESRLNALLDGPGAAANVGQGAVVVLDAATGAVRAMAGGRDYRASTYNRAAVARRQPGSSFKPFIWLAALEHGMRPDDLVLDAPIRIGNWSPSNFEGKFQGEITLEEALADSVNTVSVRLLLQSGGPAGAAEVARRLGVVDTLPNNASLALGTGDVGLLEMAGAYASFFNGGRLVSPRGLEAITADGKPVALLPQADRQVIAPDLAAMMVRMMTAVVTRGSGRAAGIPGRLVAGKTGTTQDYRDAWFVGFCNGQIIAVWLGNDDNRPMKDVTGGSLPARLFHDIAVAAG